MTDTSESSQICKASDESVVPSLHRFHNGPTPTELCDVYRSISSMGTAHGCLTADAALVGAYLLTTMFPDPADAEWNPPEVPSQLELARALFTPPWIDGPQPKVTKGARQRVDDALDRLVHFQYLLPPTKTDPYRWNWVDLLGLPARDQ